MIKSPLNYTGSKFKLLDQLIPLFPSDTKVFADMFTGGGNVGVNVKADKVVCNDILEHTITMYQVFKEYDTQYILDEIYKTIEEYGLSSNNQEQYIKIRADYNQLYINKSDKFKQSILLFIVIRCCFNNMLRFNKKGGFNQTFGKRCFSKETEHILLDFINEIKSKDIEFICGDFEQVPIDKDVFLYCDPPYLITDAGYSSRWSDKEEIRLLNYLKECDSKGIKFALSNVIEHCGVTNEILDKWIKDNGYNIHYLDIDYSNCKYNKKNKDLKSVEVLVTNY